MTIEQIKREREMEKDLRSMQPHNYLNGKHIESMMYLAKLYGIPHWTVACVCKRLGIRLPHGRNKL